MSGKMWLRQLLNSKIDECAALEKIASDKGNKEVACKYGIVCFKLMNRLLMIRGVS